jgi:mannosyltransferase
LRFVYLTRKSFWFDEGVSAQIARLDWYNFARILWRREANMSLYYLLLRGWLHIGHSEFFIRSLSVAASLATLPVLYWLGRRLFDRRVALIATLLLTFNAYHIRYAQEARSYSLFVFLGTLSSAFFLEGLACPSRRNRLGHILASVLAVYAHFYAVLLLMAQWLSLRFLDDEQLAPQAGRAESFSWRNQWKWVAALTAPVLLFVATTGAGPLNWIKRPGFKDLYVYYRHMAGNGGLILLLAYVVPALAAIAPVVSRLVRRRAAWQAWHYQFLLLWLLFPVLFTVVVSFARPMFVARYFVFCLPAFILLAAAGLARLRQSWLLAPALMIMVALSLRGTLFYYDHDFDLDRDDWRAASYYILDHAHPGDVIIFHIAMARMPYEFYKSVYPGQAPGPAVIYPSRGARVDYRDFMGKPSREFLQSVPEKYARVWVVLKSNRNRDGNPDPTTQTLSQMFRDSYRVLEEKDFPGVQIRFYGP